MYLSHHGNTPAAAAKKSNRWEFIMRRRRNRLKTKGKTERVKKMDGSDWQLLFFFSIETSLRFTQKGLNVYNIVSDPIQAVFT
jgi:hypothetical protein